MIDMVSMEEEIYDVTKTSESEIANELHTISNTLMQDIVNSCIKLELINPFDLNDLISNINNDSYNKFCENLFSRKFSELSEAVSAASLNEIDDLFTILNIIKTVTLFIENKIKVSDDLLNN